MNLLLDTHALIWWLEDDSPLSQDARTAIADQSNAVYVSAATVWEISIKQTSQKLDAPTDVVLQVDENFIPLPISLTHADAAGRLPRLHTDPFDRMLIAQALAEDLTIVTRDPQILAYNVSTLLA